MREHEQHAEGDVGRSRAQTSKVEQGSAAASAGLLTPQSAMHLQRTAGNAAVSSAITVQRKHVGSEMLEFSDGTIQGNIDAKAGIISITDGWIKG